MSNFLIFKAAFNNSATPAIGTYTAEGGTAYFIRNLSISPDYYLYNTAQNSAVQWFVPTTETTDFEFVADILTRNWSNQVTYFIIADSTETTRLRMWSVNDNWHFENSDSITTSGTEYIGTIRPSTSGGFGVFHQFRVRVRKLTASSSSVEVYVDGALKLTATAEAALITCAKIGFVGGVGTSGPGTDAGIKNAYVYDLSGGDVIDRGVLSGAFTRFISWAKNIFATKDNVVLRHGGNIMTGTKLGRPNDNGTFSISGGTTVGGTTGYIKCYGATESTYPGAVEIGGDNIKFIFRNGAIESWAGSQNLGSSSRRFGTAYIEALNINGTAAGDILTHNASEFVDVSSNQTIDGNKDFTNISAKYYLKATKYVNFNDNSSIYINGGSGWNLGAQILLNGKNNTTIDDEGNITVDGGGAEFRCVTNLNGIFSIYFNNNNSIKEPQFSPTHNTINLGTSTSKWKTFNGINPGALSLPSMNFISLDTTAFDVTATTIGAFTSTIDGWAILSITQKNKPFGIWLLNGSYRVTFQSVHHATDYMIFALIPVWTNLNLTIYCTADDIDSTRKVDWLRLFPCQGNV